MRLVQVTVPGGRIAPCYVVQLASLKSKSWRHGSFLQTTLQPSLSSQFNSFSKFENHYYVSLKFPCLCRCFVEREFAVSRVYAVRRGPVKKATNM